MSVTLAPELENVLLRFGVLGSRRLVRLAVVKMSVVSRLSTERTDALPANSDFTMVIVSVCHERTHSSNENVVALSVVGQQQQVDVVLPVDMLRHNDRYYFLFFFKEIIHVHADERVLRLELGNFRNRKWEGQALQVQEAEVWSVMIQTFAVIGCRT